MIRAAEALTILVLGRVVVRFGWRLGACSGASRGEVAGAARIENRDEGRVEGRVDFGLISISAEPVPDFHLGKAGTGMSNKRRPREADAWFL